MSVRKTGSLATVLILTLAAQGCSDSTGATPPDIDRMILFTAQSTASPGTNSLYGVMPDGSGLIKFAEQGMGQVLFPRRSRDRQQIAFGTGANGSNNVWMMRGDVTGAHAFYNPTNCPSGIGVFSWSPSGDRVLADCDNVQVVIKVSDGTSYSLSQAWGRLATHPDWSPLGDRILYQSSALGGDTYVANLDGSGATLIATRAENPVWSPDGQHIAFEQANPNQSGAIFVANADGTGQRQLTFPPDLIINDVRPAWSPDGKQLVFVRYQIAQLPYSFHLNVINVDGTGLKNITPDTLTYILDPDW